MTRKLIITCDECGIECSDPVCVRVNLYRPNQNKEPREHCAEFCSMPCAAKNVGNLLLYAAPVKL